jgi:hypothetical protein
MLEVVLDSSVLTDHSYLIITDIISPLYGANDSIKYAEFTDVVAA